MKITSTGDSVPGIQCTALVVGVWKDEPLSGIAATVDEACEGLISRLIDSGDIATSRYKVTWIPAVPGIQAESLAVTGLGAREDSDSALSFRAASAAARKLADRPRERVVFGLEAERPADAIAGSMTGCTGQDLFRKEKNLHPIGNIVWCGVDQRTLQRGTVLGRAVDRTRSLVNRPADRVFPESFAAEAVSVGEHAGFDVEVWDEKRLEEERCGALMAVARGSDRPPRLLIMKWNGGADQPPLALVGKGVTFDSGGLSLKPGESMLTMKCDMAGAATVLGAMQAIAELNLPVNVIGLVGLVENMVSGNSYKLGDVLTARNGTTIEVHNTDAEGRLVLADVLDVAVTRGAGRIIDLATLTGACVVALGTGVAGLMSNDDAWLDTVRQAAAGCGETAWPLPMFAEYDELIGSQVADIKNVGEGRWGGAITAAKLLQHFVDDLPWVHVDIAGPAFADKPLAWQDAGATGYFTRTLVDLVEGLQSGS